MPVTLSDYLLRYPGVPAVYVQAINNSTTTAYVSASPTDGQGMFTLTGVPAGTYTLNFGPTNTGPWTATRDTNYVIADPAASGGSDPLKANLASPTFTGVITAPVAQFKGSPWYDVKAYGAIGDGVTDDTAAFTSLFNALIATPKVGYIPAGTFKISSTLPTLTKAGISLQGAGSSIVTLLYTGSGDCIRFQQSPFSNHPASPASQNTGPKIGGFTIDGTSSAAGAVGLHYGDVVGGWLDDLNFQHFNGAGSVGLRMDNATNWTERTTMNRVMLADNTIGIKWTIDNANGVTVSFGYTRMLDVKFEAAGTQKCMSFQGTGANSLSFYNSVINIHANLGGTATFIEVLGNCIVGGFGLASAGPNSGHLVAEGPVACTFINVAATASFTFTGVLQNGNAGGVGAMPIVGIVQTYLTGSTNLLVPYGAAPTLAAGANAGTGPPAPAFAGGGPNTDSKGLITFGTGTGPSAGVMVTVTNNMSFPPGSTPSIFLQPFNAATAALGVPYPGVSVGNWTLSVPNAPAASQSAGSYGYFYWVIG